MSALCGQLLHLNDEEQEEQQEEESQSLPITTLNRHHKRV